VWELNLQMELAHLQQAADLLRRFDGREPEEIVGIGLPEPFGFDANRDFLRRLLATRLDPDTLGSSPIREVPEVREARQWLESSQYLENSRRPTMTDAAPDVIDVLLEQHSRIEALFYEIEVAPEERRQAPFDELVRLLAVHESVEEEVVHPLARDRILGGHEVIRDRVEEERELKQMLVRLIDAGTGWDGFETALLELRDAVLTHAGHEERFEFPQLREHVPAERLREMAGTARATEQVVVARPGR
jgi:hypothetical protein